MSGKLIVIEGSDGSGKATQTRRLYERLCQLKVNTMRISFPNYESESSALIQMYLRGDFGGNPEEINPYAISAFYAVDRFANLHTWKPFYDNSGIILSDRYVSSNMAYQGLKFKKKVERSRFFTWLEDLEYNRFGLPKPDLTIFLDMPPKISAILRKERGREDIHENDSEYMNNIYSMYKELSTKFHWQTVNCAENNFARSVLDIHEDVFTTVEEFLLLT